MSMNRQWMILAFGLALLGDWLLWGQKAGPGWVIWVSAYLAGTIDAGRRLERPFPLWTLWLWAAAWALAASQFLYAGKVVVCLGPPLCLLTTGLAVYHSLALRSTLESLGSSPIWSLSSWLESNQAALQQLPSGQVGSWGNVLRAIPVVGLFGVLLMAADPAFLRFWQDALAHFWEGLGRGARVLVLGSLASGLFWQACWREAKPVQSWTQPSSWGLSLGLTNLLFASFLALQGRYLFQGQAPPGMSLAQYARHGFFELFLVAVLVVLWLTHMHQREQGKPLNRQAALLVILSFGLTLSSALRMAIYIENFGLTLTRAYVLACLGGIVVTLGWMLSVCLVCRSAAWLQARLWLTGLVCLAVTGLTNLEGWVAATNLARREVDYGYLQGLSSDILGQLGSSAEQRKVRQIILQREGSPRDWREWRWGRPHSCAASFSP
jgi:hypothetical protein